LKKKQKHSFSSTHRTKHQENNSKIKKMPRAVIHHEGKIAGKTSET